jgi:hypothetical protein
MLGYLRVKLNKNAAIVGGIGRTFFLEVTNENEQFLCGYEVDRYGERKHGSEFDARLHVISLNAIQTRTPLRMNNTYAELEKA